MTAERVYQGIGVTEGIAVAPIYLLPAAMTGTRKRKEPAAERTDLERAMAEASAALEALMSKVPEEAAAMLEFQLVLLEDEELLQPAFSAIAAGSAAEDAWRLLLDGEIADYRSGGPQDEAFAARASDLADLRDRVLRALYEGGSAEAAPSAASIILADDLAPSRFLEMANGAMAGLALGAGSRSSHISILARAQGLPLVVGLGQVPSAEHWGEAILDAGAGCLVLHPGAETKAAAAVRAQAQSARRRQEAQLLPEPAVTATGEPVATMINVDHPAVLESVAQGHCDGIGLTRTEFLFADGAPEEEAQFVVYRQVLNWAAGLPVTIRTLDAGGDKPPPGIVAAPEANPFLGVRGLRLSLRAPELFKVQLRALLRAAALGPLKVMVPMVTEPSELEAVRELLLEAEGELTAEGADFARPLLGMMVEVPAAALAAAHFDADFYSIGTNDLVQYATACARDNPALNDLARGDHPGVVKMIEAVVTAGMARGVEVSVCGEMASDSNGIASLLASGVRILSVAPAELGRVKAAVAAYGGEEVA